MYLQKTANKVPTERIEEKASSAYKKIYFYTVILLAIFVSVLGLAIYFLRHNDSARQVKTLKTWINCNDVRDVVEEAGNLYVACLGGVMVVNKDSGEIVNEINIEDGLLSDSTTDLLLHTGKLYIGSQGGVDIYNLQTNKITHISTASGLPSNHNIRLAADSDAIWIGTFKGLARLNLATGNIDKFTDEIPVDNSQVNIQNIFVTDKAVYIHTNSNAYTRGYIARYDKSSKTWSAWGNKDFSGIYIYGLSEFNGDVYVYTDKTAFKASDNPNGKLTEFTAIIDKISKLSPSDKYYRYLGSYGEYSFIFKQNSIYRYNLKNNEVTKFISEVEFGQNGPIVNKNIYTFPLNSKKPWLFIHDAVTGSAKTISINRPSAFLDVLGNINNEVFVSTNKGIYFIDVTMDNLDFGSLNQVSDLADFEYGLDVIPIPNSGKIVFFGQKCSMTCENAQLVVYDYVQQTTISDNPPSNITPKKQLGYNGNIILVYVGVGEKDRLIFTNTNQDFDVKWLSYDLESGWKVETQEPKIAFKYEKQDCAPSFTYDSENKTIRSELVSCSKSEITLPFQEGLKSLLKLQDKYVGVYTWGGLFRYTPNSK